MGVVKVPDCHWANTGNQELYRQGGYLCPKHILSTLQALRNVAPLRLRSVACHEQGDLDWVKASWLAARPGREVIEIVRRPIHGKELWEVVLVEDDKALVTVRADSRKQALTHAMVAVGYGNFPF
jgi:hypothetical protein